MTRRAKKNPREVDSAHEARVPGGGDRPVPGRENPPRPSNERTQPLNPVDEDLGQTSDEYLRDEPPQRQELEDMTAGQDVAFTNPDVTTTAPGPSRTIGGFGSDTERLDQSETAQE